MSDLVRFRRFKDSDGFATGAMVLHEDGGWVRYQDAAKRIRELEAEVERLRRENDIMHHNVNEHLRVADKWKARFEGLIRDVSDLPSVPLDAPAEGRAILMEDISSMLAKLKEEVRCE